MRSLILVSIFIVSAFSASAEEVYFCSGKNTVEIKGEDLKRYAPENFKMQVTQEEISIKNDGWFASGTTVVKVDRWSMPSEWRASHYDPMQATQSHLSFSYDLLHYVFVGWNKIVAINAHCNKF